MPSSHPKNIKRPDGLLLIDWNTGGHHQTYLREYVSSFSDSDQPVVVMCPEDPSPDFHSENMIWNEIPTMQWLKSHQQLGMLVARWRYAKLVAGMLRKLERQHGIRCSRVFFGCFYENQSKLVAALMRELGLPSSGLYLQAGVFHARAQQSRSKSLRKVGLMLRHPMLDRIFMLDQGMIEQVADYTGKTVVHLPDITDHSKDGDDSLPRELGLIPKVRPVIGLLGHIRPSKGVAEMIAFARSVPELDATFLLAGSCRWAEFPPEEEEMIKRAVAEDPRIIFHPERIPEETSYNALVRACDVLWAFYRDSPHSSNTLAKGAFFERPVVVAEGHLMARVTRRYSLGAVVEKNDMTALREVLVPMLADPNGWLAANPPRWEEFRRDNSKECFGERLREWACPQSGVRDSS